MANHTKDSFILTFLRGEFLTNIGAQTVEKKTAKV